jgi:hypothetical protein
MKTRRIKTYWGYFYETTDNYLDHGLHNETNPNGCNFFGYWYQNKRKGFWLRGKI